MKERFAFHAGSLFDAIGHCTKCLAIDKRSLDRRR
jgi:hypothetical protein